MPGELRPPPLPQDRSPWERALGMFPHPWRDGLGSWGPPWTLGEGQLSLRDMGDGFHWRFFKGWGIWERSWEGGEVSLDPFSVL